MVTEDEVRRVVQAIQALGMNVYSDDYDHAAERIDGPPRSDVCCEDAVVEKIFQK